MKELSLDVTEGKNDAAEAEPTEYGSAQETQREFLPVLELSEENGKSLLSGSSCYFPCNREDALLLLGGLFISGDFPDPHILLPVHDKEIFLFDDSLKDSEVSLLSGGREENFPLLLEVAKPVLSRSPKCIGFADVLCIVFRNDVESTAFRFRPVDEFNPEALPFRVDPALFCGDGEPRFSLRPHSGNTRLGQLADRIPAGLHFLMSLAEKHPECRKAALSIFSSSVDPALQAGFSVSQVLACGLAPVHEDSPLTDELIGCFLEFEGYGASQLLEKLQARLGHRNSSSEEHCIEVKWLKFAADVIQSRVPLSSDHLSDQKSIALRAALLALIPESVEQIEVFLGGETPAGTMVAANAAFLTGIKTGLTRIPWRLKNNQAAQLGELARTLFETVVAGDPYRLEPFVVSSLEAETSTRYLISAAGSELVAWDIPTPLVKDEIIEFWESEFARTGFEVIGQGRTKYSWIIKIDEELPIEVQHSACNERYFPILRYVFTEGVKLRKAKEIKESFIGRGRFWYFLDSSCQPELACDLPELPFGYIRELLKGRLKDAIEDCIATRKLRKPRASKKVPAA